MRVIDWRDGAVVAIDQTGLPRDEVWLELRRVDDLIDAIERLAVRGAPALGVAGALGVALAHAEGLDGASLAAAVARLRACRPTAVNLARGVDEAAAAPDPLACALALLERTAAANRALASRGAELVRSMSERPLLAIHTHCNTGALACVEGGTALGVIEELFAGGHLERVLVDETRPLLQGARLTTWELARAGIPHVLLCDGAGPAAIARGLVDVVIVGADRIASNGDVANKVGTYSLALAAARSGVPFVVAAPESTVDLDCPGGDAIEIELRDGAEVLALDGVAIAPPGTQALNIAFDVTPADLVSAIVTEERIWRPGTSLSGSGGEREETVA